MLKTENIALEVCATRTDKVKSDETAQVYISNLEANATVPYSQFIKTKRIILEVMDI